MPLPLVVLNVFQLLIDFGADLCDFDERGQTPLDLAIREGYFDCALLLIQSGARVENIVNGSYSS